MGKGAEKIVSDQMTETLITSEKRMVPVNWRGLDKEAQQLSH